MIENITILCADWAKSQSNRRVWQIQGGQTTSGPVTDEAGRTLDDILAYAETLDGKVIIGVDAAIGVPRHVIERFKLGEYRPNADFFEWIDWLFSEGYPDDPVNTPDDWHYSRPFISVPPGKGSKQAFPDSGIILNRKVENGLRANSPLIVSGIPGTVGSGSRELWRELASLANKDIRNNIAIWPFDGSLDSLITDPSDKSKIIIAEIYPKACYGIALTKQLPAALTRIAKTKHDPRKKAMQKLLTAIEGRIDIKNIELCEDSEDEFDAMISTVAIYKLLENGLKVESQAAPDLLEGDILGKSAIDLKQVPTAIPSPGIFVQEMHIQTLPQKILYIDMDNVLVDFQSGINRLDPDIVKKYKNDLDDVPGIFALMSPMDGAIDAFTTLTELYDTYILSTAPWNNPTAWSDKLLWVRNHLGTLAEKRLILTHHKNLNQGDYLVDDRLKRGAENFSGEHIHFGQKNFPDWDSVLRYLVKSV